MYNYNEQEYVKSRRADYPAIEDQLEMIYLDKLNGTSEWVDLIGAIKDAHPKPVE